MPKWHSYGYEVWPIGQPTASYPIQLPGHVAAFVRDDCPTRTPVTVPDGFWAYRVQHNRYQCSPPCAMRPPWPN